MQRLDQAEAAFRGGLKAAPKSLHLLVGLGHTLRQRGDRLGALGAFQAASELQPDNASLQVDVAYDLRALDRVGEAETACDEALGRDQNHLGALRLKASLAKSRGAFEQALIYLRSAAALIPDDAGILGELGNLLRQMQRPAEAEAAYRRGLAAAPASIGLLTGLGHALRQRGDRAGALAAFEAAAEAASDNATLRVDVAHDLRALDRADEAEAACAAALARDGDHLGALRLKASLAKARGGHDEALGLLQRAVVLRPTDTGINAEIGNLLFQLQRLDEAEATFQMALVNAPDSVGLLVGLGHTLRKRGNRIGSLSAFRSAASVQPDNISLRLDVVHDLRALDRADEAEAACREALARDGNHLAALRLMASLAKARGGHDEALALLQRAATLRPDDAGIAGELSAMLRQMNRLDEAEAALRQGLDHAPGNVGLLAGLGHTLRQRGDRQGSLAAFLAAAEVAPDNANLRVDAAYDLDELGRPAEAEVAARAALAIKPAHAPAVRLIANLLRRRGAFQAADALFEDAARQAGGDVAFDNEYAHYLLQTGRAELAEQRFGAVLAAEPSHIGALIGLGHVQMERRQEAAAEASFRAVLERDPHRTAALMALGHLARRHGRRQAALDMFKAAEATDPAAPEPKIEIAAELRDRGDFAAARALLEALLTARPGLLHARLQLGLLLRRQGDRAAALAVFDDAARRHSQRIEPLLELSAEHRAAGRPARAQALLDAALAREPGHLGALLQALEFARLAEDAATARLLIAAALTDHRERLAIYPTVARALADLGDEDEAFAVLDDGERRFGLRPEIAATRADLLRQAGRLPEAQMALAAVPDTAEPNFYLFTQRVLVAIAMGDWPRATLLLATAPATTTLDRARVSFFRGQIADGQRRYPEAIAAYGEALAHNPEDGWGHAELARVRLLTLDLAGAREHFTRSVQLNASANQLRGLSLNISQHHLGQILDEFALDGELLKELQRTAAMADDAAIAPLAALVRANPDHTPSAMLLLIRLRQAGLFDRPAPAHTDGEPAIPRLLIQYWDQPSPPEGIAALMAGWRAAHPSWEYVRYNDTSAREFIAAHHGADVARAYQLSRHPAQRADIFRLAHLAVTGGVYIDADDRALTPLDAVIPPSTRFFGYQENYGTLGNNVIGATLEHPVILRALEEVTAAITRGDSDHLWLATGPGLVSRALACEFTWNKLNPEFAIPPAETTSPTLVIDYLQAECLHNMTILEQGELQRHVGLHCRMPYKKTEKHWGRQSARRTVNQRSFGA
jgi:tetratricopeptide (TPR) repeat protein